MNSGDAGYKGAFKTLRFQLYMFNSEFFQYEGEIWSHAKVFPFKEEDFCLSLSCHTTFLSVKGDRKEERGSCLKQLLINFT